MSCTATAWVKLRPRNYLISKPFGIATSCGTSDFSTRSTCAAGGPWASKRSRSISAPSEPSATTSTDPSRRLRASPRSPRPVACRHTHQRNPTPWTWPCTRKRMAATQALPLPPLRGPPAVPPDVDRRDPRQHRQDNEHGASGVALRLLIEHLEDHVFPAADEPADPGQNGAPNQRAQSGEHHESAQVHSRDAGGNRDEVAHDGQHTTQERADLAVGREIAF